LAALFVVPASAFAQTGTIIDWGPDSYAWETGYNSATYITSAGSDLQMVGIVNGFAGALASNNPARGPGFEYTYYITGFRAIAATTVTSGPTLSVYKTTYSGPATIEIYRDTSPDAAFGTNPGPAGNTTVPSTFTDGTLFLRGSIPSFTVTVTRVKASGAYLNGASDTGDPPNGIWTGGSALAQVSAGGNPCPFRMSGGWDMRPSDVIAGYVSQFDGHIDLNCPTATTSSTWGKIKSQYRD
jgi:hypothetical protein